MLPRVGFFAPVRVNQAVRIGSPKAKSPRFRGTGELLTYDRTGPHCAEPALYVCRAGAAASDHWTAGGDADADRHLSRHPNPRNRRGLAVHGPAAGPDGRPY